MLNEKQKCFCEQYLVDLNATQAAIRAGYSSSSANRVASVMLSKHDIQAYITELRLKQQERTAITSDWVLNRFKEISDRCMQAEPVMIKNSEGQWVESGEYQFDSAGANKATENIGKHIGFYEKDNEQSKPNIKAYIGLDIDQV